MFMYDAIQQASLPLTQMVSKCPVKSLFFRFRCACNLIIFLQRAFGSTNFLGDYPPKKLLHPNNKDLILYIVCSTSSESQTEKRNFKIGADQTFIESGIHPGFVAWHDADILFHENVKELLPQKDTWKDAYLTACNATIWFQNIRYSRRFSWYRTACSSLLAPRSLALNKCFKRFQRDNDSHLKKNQ